MEIASKILQLISLTILLIILCLILVGILEDNPTNTEKTQSVCLELNYLNEGNESVAGIKQNAL